MRRKLCPHCEELLKTDGCGNASCNGCGWSGDLRDGLKEPSLPAAPKMPYVSIDIETTGLDPDTCQILEFGAIIDDWKTPINKLPVFRRVLLYEKVSGSPFAMALNASLLKFIANAPNSLQLQCLEGAVSTWLDQCSKQDKQHGQQITALLRSRFPDARILWWTIPDRLFAIESIAQYPNILRLAANPPGISCSCKPELLGPLFQKWLIAHGLNPYDVQVAGKNFAGFDAQFLWKHPNFKCVKFRHRVIDPAILYWRPLEDDRLPDSKTCSQRSGGDGHVAHTAVDDALAVVWQVRKGVKRVIELGF